MRKLIMLYTKTSQPNKVVIIFLSLFFLITALLAYLSTGTYESGDSIQHYLIARYSFQHPELLLDHWGKPFFTLLAAPFAQFGFLGICIFNITCATLSGYIAYKIASILSVGYSWLAPIFVLFAPIYYVTLVSGLTEPLFALVLLTGIYFCLTQHFSISAIVISFLPFIRSEGFFLLPLFALVFTVKRNYKASLLLFVGTILYSVIGYFHYNDIFWIWNKNPYSGAAAEYQSGSPFHFIAKNEFILGLPLVIFFLLGIVNYIENRKKILFADVLLIPGIFFTYFVVHSIYFWKGTQSVGLIRVLAGVTPLAGIVAMRGFSFLVESAERINLIHRLHKVKSLLLLLLIALICWMPFKQHAFPRPLGYDDKVVKIAAGWIRENQALPTKYYYQYPFLSVFLNVDPFDLSVYTPLWSFQKESVPSGAIVIWDNHFGPNESKLPLTTLTSSADFELLKSFKGNPTDTPGDKEVFEIVVFKRK